MPRKVNWTSVESSTEGDFNRIKPGAYVATITEMTDVTSKEYVDMVFDIAEGDYKGHYSAKYYEGKPWSHDVKMSYKDSALGWLKGRLETIQACNPGFDPFAAWDADRLDMFIGRKVGVVLREEEYWFRGNDNNEAGFKMGEARCYRLCTIEDVTSGKFAEVKPKMLDEKGKRDALSRAGFGDADIAMILMAPDNAGEQKVEERDIPAGVYNGELPF